MEDGKQKGEEAYRGEEGKATALRVPLFLSPGSRRKSSSGGGHRQATHTPADPLPETTQRPFHVPEEIIWMVV